MKILYINHYAGSLKHGMEFRPYYLASEWVKKGHSVRIVASDYSHLRRENPVVTKDFELEMVDGIEYQWIKSGDYDGNGVKRAFSMFRFVSKLWFHAPKIVKRFQPDVVITSSTYPLDSYAAFRIAKYAKCKYVHEAHDIWPLTLTTIGGMSKRNPFVILLGIGEKYTYRKADKIVSLLPYSYKHMLNHGLESVDKFVHIPNGIVMNDWVNPSDLTGEHLKFFESMTREGKFVVCYLGGHALSNSLDVLLDAAARSKEEHDIVYVLIGNGVEKERLKARAENEALTNVYFLPPINKTAVPRALHYADALYIGAKRCELYQYGVSMNKVYDYMMAGRPIIYGVEAANNDVEDAHCGITIAPDCGKAVFEAAQILRNLPAEQRVEMGERGTKWVVENCNYEVLADRFLDVLSIK